MDFDRVENVSVQRMGSGRVRNAFSETERYACCANSTPTAFTTGTLASWLATVTASFWVAQSTGDTVL